MELCFYRSLSVLRLLTTHGLMGLLVIGLLSGCKGLPTPSEKVARANLGELSRTYEAAAVSLPALQTNAPLSEYLLHAMLRQPRVAAAYYDYAAAVERITVERSLPDPRLTFEMDIQDVVMVVMPGLMADVPWMKKLRIQADMVSAESQSRYHAFEAAVLQTALEVKQPYYRLSSLNERLRINHDTLRLLAELEEIARSQNEAGKVTLQDVLRAQIEQERLRTEIANLEDSRQFLMAQLKAALGLSPEQPNPPEPVQFESTTMDLTPDQLLASALARNPRLKQMEAELRAAEAGIRLARQSRLPDFGGGIEVDARANPLMWRPSLSATLPIWRDKIAAEIAAAQARRSAAAARVSAEQIQLAVEFADQSLMFREANRNVRLLAETLVPKARLSWEVARGAYTAGRVDFINLLDAERTLLEFQVAEVEARTQRELALAQLSLLIAGLPPAGAPLLGKAVY